MRKLSLLEVDLEKCRHGWCRASFSILLTYSAEAGWSSVWSVLYGGRARAAETVTVTCRTSSDDDICRLDKD